ncbi:hypothetical protein V0288_24450 [Pannus brasiliensis CCIBt3594]|uniref:Uncharacterized protein n=1 Tax=Pannus brasiliensis CCIBt3594 TaxID=1427578 RepID=A0AAW9R1F1_9CHRO
MLLKGSSSQNVPHLSEKGCKKLVVTYRNSKKEELQVAEKIRKGQKSRWIDLKGDRRCLEKIKLVGDTDDRSKKEALVEFWGRY